MRPGSTVRPEASITSPPGGRLPLDPPVVTASMRPPSIVTRASRTGGAPVPSISVPARTIVMALLARAFLDRGLGRLPANLLGREQLHVVEPDVGVEAALGGEPAQLTDAPGAGVVRGEREEALVERGHGLFRVVLVHHGAHELDPGVDVGLDLRDVAGAHVLTRGGHDLHDSDRPDGAPGLLSEL